MAAAAVSRKDVMAYQSKWRNIKRRKRRCAAWRNLRNVAAAAYQRQYHQNINQHHGAPRQHIIVST